MKKILAQLNLVAENLENNSDILNANKINLVMSRLVESEKGCPDATQDIKLNLTNRQKAIDEFGYGPADPSQKNEKFWKKKMDMWKVDDLSEVKNMLCGNCAAFDITSKMLNCIEKGIGSDEESFSPLDTIDAGHLGYCRFLKFKCASERTCDAWVTGGPITDKKKK
jgi:hypothetical protein